MIDDKLYPASNYYDSFSLTDVHHQGLVYELREAPTELIEKKLKAVSVSIEKFTKSERIPWLRKRAEVLKKELRRRKIDKLCQC